MTNDKIASAFSPAKQSIDWANAASDELHALAQTFFDSNPAEIITETDPDTAERIQKVKLVTAFPNSLSRRVTEALVHARHSFDQAIFAARNVLAGRVCKGVNYPWARNPSDLKILLEQRNIDERLWDTIFSHEPYPRSDIYSGGNDLIRNLANLANRKHDIGLSANCQISSTTFPSIIGNTVESLEVLTPRWDANKNEAILIRWRGDVEVHGKYNFRFQVVFKDARLAESVDAITASKLFTSKADEVVKSLEARCIEVLY